MNIYLEEVYMKKNLLDKTLTLGLIVLFIGAGIYPAFAVEINSTMISNQSEKDCGCEAKNDYKPVIAERLITKLKIYINRILLKINGIPEIEEEFKDILDTFNSDRPICDFILQINESISKKQQDIWDLVNKYKYNPIRGRIYLCYILILLSINIYLIPLWFLSDCGDWP